MPIPTGEEIAHADIMLQLQYDAKFASTTALFRANCCLPEAARLAVENCANPEQVTVVSAAASTGAELDSAVALLLQDERVAGVRAVGLDLLPRNIELARTGQHAAEEGQDFSGDGRAILKTLGFRVYDDDIRGDRAFIVDALPVRAGNDVVFQQHDLLDGPADVQADLVLCNQLLRHMVNHRLPTVNPPRPKARDIVQNLAAMIREGGILSVGVQGLARYVMDHSNEAGQPTQEGIKRFATEQLGLDHIEDEDTAHLVQFYRKPITSTD